MCCQINVSVVIFSFFNTIKVRYSGYFYFDSILMIVQQLGTPLSKFLENCCFILRTYPLFVCLYFFYNVLLSKCNFFFVLINEHVDWIFIILSSFITKHAITGHGSTTTTARHLSSQLNPSSDSSGPQLLRALTDEN